MRIIILLLSIVTMFNSCETTTRGCTDPLAINYDPYADLDNGSCLYVQGCTDPLANNFDPTAVVEPLNICQYSTNLVYYLDYSASQYMSNWGISFYAFYDDFGDYIGYITNNFWWSSPPNCLPQNDGSTLTSTIYWEGNYDNNIAEFTWRAYPDDGPIADYVYTEIVTPGGCVQLGLSKKKIQEYKESK